MVWHGIMCSYTSTVGQNRKLWIDQHQLYTLTVLTSSTGNLRCHSYCKPDVSNASCMPLSNKNRQMHMEGNWKTCRITQNKETKKEMTKKQINKETKKQTNERTNEQNTQTNKQTKKERKKPTNKQTDKHRKRAGEVSLSRKVGIQIWSPREVAAKGKGLIRHSKNVCCQRKRRIHTFCSFLLVSPSIQWLTCLARDETRYSRFAVIRHVDTGVCCSLASGAKVPTGGRRPC